MKIINTSYYLLSLGLLLLVSCNTATDVGAELLDQDQVNVLYTDTITIKAATVGSDSLRTFAPSSTQQLRTYLVGDYKDPIFGNIRSECYIQPRLPNSTPPDSENDELIFDSLILTLVYDTSSVYGNINEDISYQVLRVNEVMDNTATFYSTDDFSSDVSMPLAEFTINPENEINDSLYVTSFSSNGTRDTSKVYGHLRIPLSAEFGQAILDEPLSTFENSDDFAAIYNGLHIRSTSMESSGIVGFNFISASTKMTLYYSVEEDDGELTPNEYGFVFSSSSVKTVNFEQDLAADVESNFGDFEVGKEKIHLQGAIGPDFLLELPYVEQLNDIVVNKAELEFTINSTFNGTDENLYPPINLMIGASRDGDGALVSIEDVLVAETRQDISLYGGTFEEEIASNGETVKVYKVNITRHIQSMIDGIESNQIYFRSSGKAEQVNRITLYGTDHSEYPIKLNLTYTTL